MTYENWCEYGDHQIENLVSYVIYSDQDRGLDNVKMCKHCYALHVLKYFPNSHMAMYIRNNPTEYRLTLDERFFGNH